MGADIFIQNGATLTIQTAISFSNSKLNPGSGAVGGQPWNKHFYDVRGADLC